VTKNKLKLASEKKSKINHTPKSIAKFEINSASENEEDSVDSKIGIKMEIKCEPSKE
jgi:hypothetical protein